MKLHDYLKDNLIMNRAFARDLGITEVSLSRLRHGKGTPNWKTMRKVLRLSKGQVTPNDFIDIEKELSEVAPGPRDSAQTPAT